MQPGNKKIGMARHSHVKSGASQASLLSNLSEVSLSFSAE